MNLTTVALSRNLTQQEWETVHAVEGAIDALHHERIHTAGEVLRTAEREHIQVVEQVNRNHRYQELLTSTAAEGATPEETKALWAELKELEAPIRRAHAAKVEVRNAFDDADVERTAQTLGACFLAGEINGFRLGIQAFATLLTQPNKWPLTPGTPATAVVTTLLTDLGYCSDVLAKLMAEPGTNPLEGT